MVEIDSIIALGVFSVHQRMHGNDRRECRAKRRRFHHHGKCENEACSGQACHSDRVDVDTTNQVVSLNGIVETQQQKQRAEELARQVSGVKAVKNNLQIQAKK